MAEVKSSVQIDVKAETKQAVSAMNGFKDAVSKVGDGLAKFNHAMGGVQKVMDGVQYAFKAAIDTARLREMEKALPVGSLDKLRNATKGLMTDSELLRASVKGMTGDFALTADQMSTVLEAAQALERRGFGPAAETAADLTEKLRKGVDKLDDYGIKLEKTKDRNHDLTEAIKALGKVASDTAPMDAQTQSLMEAQAGLKQLSETVTTVIGTISAAIIEFAKTAGEEAAKTWLWLTGGPDAEDDSPAEKADQQAEYFRLKAEMVKDNEDRRTAWLKKRGITLAPSEIGTPTDAEAAELAKRGIIVPGYTPSKNGGGKGKGGGKASPLEPESYDDWAESFADLWRLSSEYTLPLGGSPFGGGFGEDVDPVMGAIMRAMGSPLGSDVGTDGPLQAPFSDSVDVLSKKVDEMRKAAGEIPTAMQRIAIASEDAAAAIQSFSDAFGGAVVSVLDGSESLPDAVKKATAGTMKALAGEATAKGQMMLAESLAHLVIGDFRGSGTAAAAASAYFLAAGVAGRIGNALGGGGGGTASAHTPGANISRARSDSRDGEGAPITVYVNGYVGQAKELGAEIEKQVRAARRAGTTAGAGVVEFA